VYTRGNHGLNKKKITTVIENISRIKLSPQIKLSQLVCAICALLLCNVSAAQTRYVTDDFNIMLRTGPSIQNKIVKALSSGTRLEMLREEAGNGHSQVRSAQGEIGYVLTRFLSNNPSARDRVRKLESQIEQLQSEPGSLRTLLANSQEKIKELTLQNSNLSSQLNATSTELQNIKRISGESVNLAERNEKLGSEVQQLLLQLDDIRINNQNLQDHNDKRWFMVGSMAVFGGLFFGWILSIARRPRRQSWGS